MSTPVERFQYLLAGYLNDTVTRAELTEFWQLMAEAGEDPLMQEEVSKVWLTTVSDEGAVPRRDWDEILVSIHDRARAWEEQQETEEVPVIPIRRRLTRWAVAASIIFALGFATYFLLKDKSPALTTHDSPLTTDVKAPDKNRAQIKLSDGTIIYLDSAVSGELTTAGNVTVTKNERGEVVYDGSSVTVEYNTLFNPRGSKVQALTLSDGTKLWLNAESSVTYPTAFTGNEREVTITGEAYFEVAPNKEMPFYVTNGDIQVKVLGTHFNVNAYEDEDAVRVTLLEGSVNVSRLTTHDSRLLKPGQQAVVTLSLSNGRLTTHANIDLETVMAWKNGQFSFDNADLKTVMRQIARWYDVEVVYEGPLPDEEFNGGTSRQENVSALLKVLEATGKIKFRVEGKKVFVRK